MGRSDQRDAEAGCEALMAVVAMALMQALQKRLDGQPVAAKALSDFGAQVYQMVAAIRKEYGLDQK